MLDIANCKAHMYDVIGAIHEVHDELGPGLSETCYQEALQMQLDAASITYQREMQFHPTYHGQTMQSVFRVDFLCKGNIVVECKAVSELNNNHHAQLFNYMRLLGCNCGILANFSLRYSEIERYFFDDETNEIVGTDGKPLQIISNRRK